MKKYNEYVNIGIFVSILIMFMMFMFFIACALNKNASLKAQIAEQDIIIAQYETNEDWYYEMFELYEDYYKLKLDKAVLEERIKWLNEKVDDYELPASQMYEDFMDLINLRDTYFNLRDTDTRTNFEAWVEITNPELYERITIYNNMFD